MLSPSAGGRSICIYILENKQLQILLRRLTGTQKAWERAKRLGVRQQSCRLAIAAKRR
jgi:hypothetical protein